MKKLIFLLFLPILCFADEPKFHFKDCVKIVHGFYTGCKGTVEDFGGINSYEIASECKGESLRLNLTDKEIEPTKGCE